MFFAIQRAAAAGIAPHLIRAAAAPATAAASRTAAAATAPQFVAAAHFAAAGVAARRAASTVTATIAPVANSWAAGRVQACQAAARRAMCTEAAVEAKGITGIMQANPVSTAVIITVVRTAPCDLLAQFYFEKKKELDWARFMGFIIFGGVYVGAFQYYLYRYVLNASLVNAVGITGRAGEAFSIAVLDQFIHSPFLYFPCFCLTLKLTEFSPNVIGDAFEKWSNDVVGVVKASMTLWFPTQIINFYFMPPYMIVPFINVVGAVWVVWLSLQQGKGKEEVKQE